MTPKQQQTLFFICQFYHKKGYMPSLKEIGKKFKLSSQSSRYYRVQALIGHGYLTKKFNTSRSIKFTFKAKKYLKTEYEQIPKRNSKKTMSNS